MSISKVLCLLISIFVLTIITTSAIFAEENKGNEVVVGGRSDSFSDKWGVEIVGIRLTSHGRIVDFRYRIVDPEKAKSLTDRDATPYLVDESTGEKSYVPNAPKMGSLRAKGNPVSGRTYFILFSNARGVVKKGSKVTVVNGDFKAEGLTVQ